MQYNPEIHHRRSIRLKGYDYSQSGLYCLTICTRERLMLLGEIINSVMFLSDMGNIVEICWKEIPVHFPDVVLHEFIIMPNHIHGIIEIVKPAIPVGVENFQPLLQKQTQHKFQHVIPRSVASIVRGFKIGVTK